MIGKIYIDSPDYGDIEYNENDRHVISRFNNDGMDEARSEGVNLYIDNMYSNNGRVVDNYEVHDIELKTSTHVSECGIFGKDGNDIRTSDLENIANIGKMFILKININPDTINNDTETELRFWFRDSQNILNDRTLNDRVRLQYLPFMDFFIEVKDNGGNTHKFKLSRCKMVQRYKNSPYCFCTLIEKIKYA